MIDAQVIPVIEGGRLSHFLVNDLRTVPSADSARAGLTPRVGPGATFSPIVSNPSDAMTGAGADDHSSPVDRSGAFFASNHAQGFAHDLTDNPREK